MDINQLVVDACDNNGALLHYLLEAGLAVPVVASVLANFRNKLPGPVVWFLDMIAANWVKGLAAKAAKSQS